MKKNLSIIYDNIFAKGTLLLLVVASLFLSFILIFHIPMYYLPNIGKEDVIYEIASEDESAYGAELFANGKYIGNLTQGTSVFYSTVPAKVRIVKNNRSIESWITPSIDIWVVSFKTMKIRAT